MARPFAVCERLMLVSVSQNYREGTDAYEAARYAWRVKREKVEKHCLVLACCHGVVVGAYRPDKWLPATRENFPDKDFDTDRDQGRWGFAGHEADDVWDCYVGKRVPEHCRLYGPVRYCEPG